MIDMIGFGIVIPFLTYLVEDLAASEALLRLAYGWIIDDFILGRSVFVLSLLGFSIRQNWQKASIDGWACR